jgi:hypothetical protein
MDTSETHCTVPNFSGSAGGCWDLKRNGAARGYGLAMVILAAAAALALASLDNACFWDDESDVATVARTLITTGRLSNWDGRNLFAPQNGGSSDMNFRTLGSPPLCYVIAAASFKVLGVSTWAGRFPFVVIGIAALALFAVLLREKFGGDTAIWLYGIASLGLSVVFLLNIRQCRYHAPVIFLAILTLWSYYRCIRTRKPLWFVVLGGSAIAFFYAHLLLCAAFLVAIAVIHVIFHRRALPASVMWKPLTAFGVFLLATVPYAIHYRLWVRHDFIPDPTPWYIRTPALIWWNLRDLNLQMSPPWLVLAGLIWFLVRHRQTHPKVVRAALEWIVLILAYVVFLSFLSPENTSASTRADLRYLVAIVPLAAGLTGVFLGFVHRVSRLAAILVLALLTASNITSLHPWNREVRWLLPAYLSEVSRSYPTCYSEAVRFLKEHAKQDDVVFCYPNYTHCPLLFYAGDRVLFGCTLSRETHLPLEKVRRLPVPLLIEENFPDWVISFGAGLPAQEAMRFFSRPHSENGRTVAYSYDLVKTLDVFWFDLSRPELSCHHFGPKTDFNRDDEAVYVFRRSGGASESGGPPRD